MTVSLADLQSLAFGFHVTPERSYSLPARSYVEPGYVDLERDTIFYKSWQYVCYAEQLQQPGDYIAFTIQERPLLAVRDQAGVLRAFYNVCRHRGHELLTGSGQTKSIVCPYHAWSYHLNGQLYAARKAETIENFNIDEVCLMPVQVEEFCNMIFVNLDPAAEALAVQAGALAQEIQQYAPDLAQLTHAHRLTYHIKANWKSIVDNFLECYHCPVAHKDFVSLVDMDTYKVTTYGIYSSHMASAGTRENSAYDVAAAAVQDHAVWWLWPNLALLRYPGEGNFMVWHFIPIDEETTLEHFDFFFLHDTPTAQQWAAIEYIDKILQKEDIDIVESVQRGMKTPAYEQGRFVCDPFNSGLTEHAVHHFHGLYLEAIEAYVRSQQEK